MKRFLVIYNAPVEAMAGMSKATPEQKEGGMKVWFAWKDSMGDKLIDFGAPLVGGQRIQSDRSVQAAMLSNHPHLQWEDGCDIEIHECISM
jgi:hypothetical protein